jgi:hypothetical protein
MTHAGLLPSGGLARGTGGALLAHTPDRAGAPYGTCGTRLLIFKEKAPFLCSEWWCAEGVRCRKVATLHLALSSSGAEGRERRAALSSVALSPKGVSRCGASSKTRSPSEAGNAAIACVSARPAERPRQLAGLPAPALPGCQPIAGEHGGSAPKPPGAAVPRGSAWVGRWKDPTAARSTAGALCGTASLRPGVTARQKWPLGGRQAAGALPLGAAVRRRAAAG